MEHREMTKEQAHEYAKKNGFIVVEINDKIIIFESKQDFERFKADYDKRRSGTDVPIYQ